MTIIFCWLEVKCNKQKVRVDASDGNSGGVMVKPTARFLFQQDGHEGDRAKVGQLRRGRGQQQAAGFRANARAKWFRGGCLAIAEWAVDRIRQMGSGFPSLECLLLLAGWLSG